MYIHVKGCLIFYIANLDKLWTPTNWQCPSCDGNRDYFTDPETVDFFYNKFLLAWYAAIMCLNGNDISPATIHEMIAATFGVLFGCVMNAIIFGNFVVLVQMMNRKMQLF